MWINTPRLDGVAHERTRGIIIDVQSSKHTHTHTLAHIYLRGLIIKFAGIEIYLFYCNWSDGGGWMKVVHCKSERSMLWNVSRVV